MKQCLVDLNIWLALVARHHQHHGAARRWYDDLQRGEAGFCRLVQLGLIRLLANRTIMGDHVQTPRQGWNIVTELLLDERVEFVFEPKGMDQALPRFLNSRAPAGKQVNDAYLAAFASAAGWRLVTMDSRFREFRGVDVELLR
jgi:uncharacterized protein